MSQTVNESKVSGMTAEFRHIANLDVLKDVWARFSKHQVTTLSTSFAYFWTFAIPPLLVLVTMVGVLIDNVTDIDLVEKFRDLIEERASPEFQPLLLRILDQAVVKIGSGTASVGVLLTTLLALWAASSAIAILMFGFNNAYEVTETRSWFRKKGIALGLTLMLVAMVNLAFALLIFGQRIGQWVADQLGLGSLFGTMWDLLRWPIAIQGMMAALAVVYWAGPNVARAYRLLTVGAVVATVLWLVLVAGFGIYLRYSDPGSAYGVAGSVIVLLVFLNLTGIIFFLGGEFDAAIWREQGNTVPPLPDA